VCDPEKRIALSVDNPVEILRWIPPIPVIKEEKETTLRSVLEQLL